jgi:hypothetical protein
MARTRLEEPELQPMPVVLTIPPPVIPIFVTTTVAACEPRVAVAVGLGLLGAAWLRRRAPGAVHRRY